MRKSILGIAVAAIASMFTGSATAQYYQFHDPVYALDFTMPVANWTPTIDPYPGQIAVQPNAGVDFMMNYIGEVTTADIPLGSNVIVWESDRQTHGAEGINFGGLWEFVNPPEEENATEADLRAIVLEALVTRLHPLTTTLLGTSISMVPPTQTDLCNITATGTDVVMPPTESSTYDYYRELARHLNGDPLFGGYHPVIYDPYAEDIGLLYRRYMSNPPSVDCSWFWEVQPEPFEVDPIQTPATQKRWIRDYPTWRDHPAAKAEDCENLTQFVQYAVFIPCTSCEEDCDEQLFLNLNSLGNPPVTTAGTIEDLGKKVRARIGRLVRGNVYILGNHKDRACYIFDGIRSHTVSDSLDDINDGDIILYDTSILGLLSLLECDGDVPTTTPSDYNIAEVVSGCENTICGDQSLVVLAEFVNCNPVLPYYVITQSALNALLPGSVTACVELNGTKMFPIPDNLVEEDCDGRPDLPDYYIWLNMDQALCTMTGFTPVNCDPCP